MDDIWTSNLNETVDNIKNNDNVYSAGKVIKVNENDDLKYLSMPVMNSTISI